MSHIGARYGDLGRLEMKNYIEGTSTFDNLRQSGWPLWVKWTDRFNQLHKVTINNASDEVTVYFPAGGKAVNWNHKGGQDRTGFDAETTWVEVKFWYIASDFFNDHGIRVHLRGYKSVNTGTYSVDWDRVKKGLDAGKTVADIAASGAKLAGAM